MERSTEFDAARANVAEQGSRSVSAFAEAADRLRQVHGDLGALGRQLDRLSSLLAAQEIDGDPVGPVAQAARALGAALAGGGADRASVFADLERAVAALDQIEREVRELGAIASITVVTAGSLGANGLDVYVVDLRRLIGALSAECGQLGRAIEGVGLALGSADEAGRRAARALRSAGSSIEAGKARREAIRSEATRLLRGLGGAARSYAEAVSRETSSLVAAIQFSDSLAQRVEHVTTMIDGAEGREGAVRALVAAQLDALAADARASAAGADRSMARLASEGVHVRDVFGAAEDEGAAGAALRFRRSDLQKIAAQRGAAADAARIASESGASVRALLSEAKERFAGLTRSSAGINLSAINAMLLTARSGASRAALGVLSDAVRECAQECAARGGECSEALRRLSEAAAPERGAAIVETSSAFSAALEDTERRLRDAEEALAEFETMRREAAETSGRLLPSVRGAREALAQVAASAAGLSEIAREFRIAAPPSPPAAALLEDLFELYTMEREREVHLAVVGGGKARRRDAPAPKPAAEAAAAAEDALADILF
ncbi:MAG: hypothetical protein ACE37J_07490 [Pikeienuella sp.]|uniref:hypothetical protein n=1 Tax=Pikeienuella sp. TaxID=2831957 RepID=UPI00391D48C1